MSSSHHGMGPDEDRIRQEELRRVMERFNAQVDRTAKREYPQGRVSGDDDGELALAVTADPGKKLIVIAFGKPVEWIGLHEKETRGLIQLLIGRLREIATEPFAIEV